jgi:hypothetical protein
VKLALLSGSTKKVMALYPVIEVTSVK